MKAVILAQNKASALSPVSSKEGAHMSSIINKPCIEYLLELLYLNEVNGCAVNLLKEDSKTEEYLNDLKPDMPLKFFYSQCYKGSAGALKLCGDFLSDNFIVLHGNCLTDLDLSQAKDAHKKSGAYVTVLTKENSPFCSVYSNGNKRVLRISQKPGWEESLMGTNSAGIYIFSKKVLPFIPEGEFSIENQLLPLLLKKGLPVFEFPVKGYVKHINDIYTFKEANFDMLNSKLTISPLISNKSRNGFKGFRPYFTGKGVIIHPTARIGPNAIIGDNCVVENDAVIKNCILGKNVTVGSGAVVSGVVGDNTVLRQGCTLHGGAFVGENCVVGRKSTVGNNAFVYNGSSVGNCITVRDTQVSPYDADRLFNDGKIEGNIFNKMTPVFAARLGVAIGEAFGGEIFVGHSGLKAQSFGKIISGALSLCGLRVINAGCSLNELRYASVKNCCPCVFIGENEDNIFICVFDSDGSPINYVLENKIQSGYFKGDHNFSCAERIYEPQVVQATEVSFIKSLERVMGPTSVKALIYGQRELCALFRKALNRSGGAFSEDIEFEFFENGKDLTVKENGLSLSRQELILILCLFENKKELPLPSDIPLFLLDRIGIVNKGEKFDAYEEYPYFYDNLFLGARLINIMESTGKSLGELYGMLPEYHFTEGVVESRGGNLIGKLKELIPAADVKGNGISITADQGIITIIPKRNRDIKVLAYSRDTESARELCFDMCDILKSIDTN